MEERIRRWHDKLKKPRIPISAVRRSSKYGSHHAASERGMPNESGINNVETADEACHSSMLSLTLEAGVYVSRLPNSFKHLHVTGDMQDLTSMD